MHTPPPSRADAAIGARAAGQREGESLRGAGIQDDFEGWYIIYPYISWYISWYVIPAGAFTRSVSRAYDFAYCYMLLRFNRGVETAW